jgi:hypothetical protein
MAFAGVRGTGNWATDERPKNFREFILWKNPNGRAPLTALLSKARKEGTNDPEFNWWEESLQIVRVQINYTTGYATSVETFTITAGGLNLVPGDELQLEKVETSAYDNEIMIVSAITNDTTIIVKRGQANTTRTTAAHQAYLLKIGNVFAEGSTSPQVASRNPSKFTNYCQIFKTAVGETGSASETKTRTGDSWTNDKKRKTFDHSVAMELAFLFGVKYEDTSGAYPKRFTGGLRSFLSSNVTIFTTTPTEDTFLDAVYKMFDYEANGAGDERIGFCGNGFLNSLNKIVRNSARTSINYDKTIDLYGMKLWEWILPQGRIGLKTHPLLNVHPVYTYSAFLINPAGLCYRPLRDTKFQDNIQANDEDVRKGQWLTEAGLEVRSEETMAYIGNFKV